MTDTITLPRSVAMQALEALKIGHESAHDCAETFHIEMAGYKQQRHEALDAEVKQISDAIGALRAALNQPQVNSPEIPEGWKLVPVEPTTKMIDAARSQSSFPAGVWRAMLAAAPQPPTAEKYSAVQPQVEQEPVAWQSIEAMAVQRYKVVPAHDSMFYRHAVVAGDGTQQLYIGRETECENIARRFAGAFLDGAYEASLYTHPQPKGEPPGSTESAYQRGYLDGMAKGRRDAALDAAEQQPVAWLLRDANNHKVWFLEKTGTPTGYRGEWIKTPLYIRPQPPRQPLTREEIAFIAAACGGLASDFVVSVARAIEAAHGIGGEE